jgi:NADPH-dependent 2,4-dienoyl-CoA reductase/sulfur reductase-like enzyme
LKFIIIGGDAAGMSAAMQIVRNSEGHSITTLEKGSIYSYGQCGLPYVIGGKIESTEQLIARTKETFQQKYGIDAKILHEVTKVDPEKKTVEGIDLGADKPFHFHYDRLLVATGAEPVIPKWEGVQLDGVFPLKTIPDAEKILSYMDSNVKRVTVIGGGYIGLEMAENFAAQDLAVTMIERNEQLAKIFDPDMGELILEEAKRNGIEVKFGETVEGFSGKERVEKVNTDKGTYDADLVLIAIGVKPNSHFLKDTGIFTENNGAIRVNSYMQTNLDDVYAAGDCATQFHRIKEVDDYIPLGTHANKQGQIAGLNMINRPKTFKGVLGTSILKFFGLSLGKPGYQKEKHVNCVFHTTV